MGVKQWMEYPKKKPKKSGWYLCSIYFKHKEGLTQSYVADLSYDVKADKWLDNRRINEHKEGLTQSYVMDLWYDAKTDKWLDNRRINVYNTYEVYKNVIGPNGGLALERMYKDRLCIRNDVVAFKILPKPYK